MHPLDASTSDSELRKRFNRQQSDSTENLSDDVVGDLSDISDDEDILGCPLPSTPEDNDLLEAEVSRRFFSKLATKDREIFFILNRNLHYV